MAKDRAEVGGVSLTQAEKNYYEKVGVGTNTSNYYKILADATEEEHEEIACVGAGIGDSFEHTTELKPMKHKEAMKTKDKPKWQKAVKEEHGNFTRCNVVQAVPKNEVPDDATIIGSTWAMKKAYGCT